MRRILPAFLAMVFLALSLPGSESQSSEQTPPPAAAQDQASKPALPVDQGNAQKAKALLEQTIQALGGQAYLNLHDLEQAGRTYSFFHGRPTSNGVKFWRFVEFPDKDRVELTEQRDVVELYVGDKGYEITFKGPHPILSKDMTDYLRRRRFSLDTLLRTWVNDPSVALFYEGYANAADRPALQVTLINAKDEAVTLDVDPDTHLPIKKSFTWRDPVDKQKNLEEELYDNYRPVQGIMTPYDVARYFNGDIAGQRFLNSASYNKGLDEAMFNPNSGYNPLKPSGKH